MQKTKTKPFSFSEMDTKFSTEEKCQEKLFEEKWPSGFVCASCGSKDYTFVKTRTLYECSCCGHQHSSTSGTIMHKTKTPLVKWFKAIYLIATDKRGISALYITKLLDLGYKTAWLMLHKIRKAMEDREKKYLLEHTIELDETFLGSPSKGDKNKGRGTKKSQIFIGASTKDEKILFAKLSVTNDASSDSIKKFVEESIAPEQTIKTDGWKSYACLSKMKYTHIVKSISGSSLKAHDVLKWVHVIAGNVKAVVDGTFHGVSKKHLQKYLYEYTYRLNRRYLKNITLNLLSHCVLSKGITLTELRG